MDCHAFMKSGLFPIRKKKKKKKWKKKISKKFWYLRLARVCTFLQTFAAKLLHYERLNIVEFSIF